MQAATSPSTNFVDTSPSQLSLTVGGDAEINDGLPHLSGDSGEFDGAGDYVQITGDWPVPLRFGADDFTVQFWCYLYDTSVQSIIGNLDDNSGNGYFWIVLNSTFLGQHTIQVAGKGITQRFGTTTLSTNTWHHIRVVRQGGFLWCFLNGSQLDFSVAFGDLSGGDLYPLAIGGAYAGTPGPTAAPTRYMVNGRIQDLQIYSGLSLGIDPFTPPTALQPTQGPPAEARIAMPGALGAPAVGVSIANPVDVRALLPGVLGAPAVALDVTQTVRVQMPGVLGAARVRVLNDFTPLLLNPVVSYALQVSTDPPTEIPISSWQATLQVGRKSYLQAVIPAYDQYADVIAPLIGSGSFSVIRRAVESFGTVSEVMATAPLSRATIQQGEINHTATISGYSDEFLDAGMAGGSRTLTGIRTRSQTGDSVRVRADIDWFVRPGDQVTAGDVTFTADFIQFFVTRGGQEYMDAGTRGSS